MQIEFVNAYIERLIREIEELTKNRLLIETRLILAERANGELLEKLDKYEKQQPEPVKKPAAKA